MRAIHARSSAVPLACLCIALGACHRTAAKSDATAPMYSERDGVISVPAGSPIRSHVAVEPVQAQGAGMGAAIPAFVEAEPSRVVNVMSPLTGRLASLDVRLGEHVRRGQVLAVVASGDLAAAYADVVKAKDALDLAGKTLARTRGVQAVGGAAQKDIEAAQSAQAQDAAELARAQDRLRSLNGNASSSGGRLVLTSPQDGVVTALSTAPGSEVDDPTATLMTVTNLDEVYVTANLPEDRAGQAVQGAQADIDFAADPSRRLHGRVSEVDDTLQADTRRLRARIEVANPRGALAPNMYASVRLALPSGQSLFVPQSALLMNNDVVTVLVQVRPWAFQRRVVTLGEQTDTTARVVSGLKAGDQVVTRGGVLFGD